MGIWNFDCLSWHFFKFFTSYFDQIWSFFYRTKFRQNTRLISNNLVVFLFRPNLVEICSLGFSLGRGIAKIARCGDFFFKMREKAGNFIIWIALHFKAKNVYYDNFRYNTNKYILGTIHINIFLIYTFKCQCNQRQSRTKWSFWIYIINQKIQNSRTKKFESTLEITS